MCHKTFLSNLLNREVEVLVGEFNTVGQLGLFPIKSGCIEEVIPVIKW